jgi:hypothetical protein
MSQFDNKNRDFYSDLTVEEKKKYSNYLMIRWGSAVQGSRDLQEFYLISCNQRLNRHFFAINRHPQLQWLCATTVSPDLGTQRHVWIAPKKREAGATGIKKQLAELYPHLKDDELAVMATITTKKELDAHMKDLVQEPKK